MRSDISLAMKCLLHGEIKVSRWPVDHRRGIGHHDCYCAGQNPAESVLIGAMGWSISRLAHIELSGAACRNEPVRTPTAVAAVIVVHTGLWVGELRAQGPYSEIASVANISTELLAGQRLAPD